MEFGVRIRGCRQVYAIKVLGKDYKTDGIKALFPNLPVWKALYGLVQDGVGFTHAELKRRMNGGSTYTQIAEVKTQPHGASTAATEKQPQATTTIPVIKNNADDDDDDDDDDDIVE